MAISNVFSREVGVAVIMLCVGEAGAWVVDVPDGENEAVLVLFGLLWGMSAFPMGCRRLPWYCRILCYC